MKTLKLRLVLTQKQKKRLHSLFGHSRWHYNATKNILDGIKEKKKFFNKEGKICDKKLEI